MGKNEKHHLKKRGDVWYFIATKNGKRYHEALSSNFREAKKIRNKYLLELKQVGYLAKDSPVDNSELSANDLLFGEVAKIWVEIQEARLKKDDIKSSTLRDYRSSMNHHVLPVFGNRPINSITASEIDDFALSLDCSKKRTNNILVPVRSLFKLAKKRKIIQENIMNDVDNLPIEHTDIYPLSKSEVQVFLDKTPEHYRPFFTTLFFTGMRFGEIAGLKWKNVDLDRGVIKVRETRVYGVEGRTKTKGSNRDIDILPPVKLALQKQRKMRLCGRYVFRDREGNLMSPDHIRNVIWKPTLKKTGLEYRPPIQTRHTFATIAIESGETLGWVQYMLGHSSLQMIFTTYHSWIKRTTQNNGSAIMKNFENSSEQFANAA